MKPGKRESLRYTFNIPVTASFKIIEIDDNSVPTSEGKAQVINISSKWN